MRVRIADLQKLMQVVLTREEFSDSNAREIAEVLLYAQLSNKNTQGIIKFFGNEPIQNMKPIHNPKVIKDTKLSALIDGGRTTAVLVARMATTLAIQKCKKQGLAIVGTTNAYASTGTLGFYVNEIVKNDFIGIMMSGTPKGVAPFGSIDKLVGVNPIAFGFPTENDPLIFDMATAAITWYGLVNAKIMGVELPDGVAVDNHGRMTKDPEKAMNGAICTFGNGHKGSGLNLMIEMFTGPLVGAMSAGSDGKWYNGSIIIAIDPDLFVGKEILKKDSAAVLNRIKRSRMSRGFREVILPGENALKARRRAEKSGEIEVENRLYTALVSLAGN